MDTRLLNQWLEINRAAWSPAVRLGELTAAAADKAMRQNLAVAQDYVEFGARRLQVLGEAKDPQKWAVEESKIAAEFGQRMLGRAGDYFKVVKETQDAVGQWAETAMKAAAEPFAAKPAETA